MTACVEIKFGTLILVISLMYIQLGKVDSTQNASYRMNWRINRREHCPTERISISCSTGQYIFLLDVHVERESSRRNVSYSTISKLMDFCNCKTLCNINRNQACIHIDNRWWISWTLYIRYQCTNDDCSDNTGSTTSLRPDTTSTYILSSGSTNATSFSPFATSQLPLSTTRTIVTENTSEQSTTLENHSMTSSLLEETTKLEEKIVPSSSVAGSTGYNTTAHATNEPQFELYSDTDEKNTDKVAIAVCVSVLGLAGCILAVILYRRWRKKKTTDYVYNNTTTKNTDSGFANLTYSETANKDDEKHDDTQSHSADSGYTDMQIEGTLDDTNADYYSIKDSKEETLQPEDDNYYAIKDNASQEYNKITFRPKSIPEDPSYVHTLRTTNIQDQTYDHVGEKECIKSALQNGDYSHFNQCKDRSCNTSTCSPIGPAFREDVAAVEPNEEGHGYTLDDKYFTLETNKNSRQTEMDQENNMSHGYFVLEKETPTKINLEESNVVGKKHLKINTAVAVQDSGLSVSSTGIVYFENCRHTDAETDCHQYQVLEPHFSGPGEQSIENVNHDYFVLDKVTNATETDK